MTRAKTLLEFAGVQPTPARLDTTTALVVIDAQNEYVTGQLPVEGIETALNNIAALLVRARKAGSPVIHIQHEAAKPGGLFDADANGSKIHGKAKPLPSEAIITKGLPNAFAKTDLGAQLTKLGCNTVVLTGFATHMCVSATARAALDLGYRAIVISDATGTRALPSPLSEDRDIDASIVHETALAELADRFATVLPSSAVL